MAKIITVANQKGGTGKTTTVLSVGAELEEKGFKVLYIDLDTQANTSKVLKADTERKGAAELVNDADSTKAEDLIQITESKAHIISASFKLWTVTRPGTKTKEKLKEIGTHYDFILIDTPPTLNYITATAFICTDYLMLVANTDIFSIDGIGNMKEIIKLAKANGNPDLKINGILIARYSQRANINKAIKVTIEQMAAAYNTKVYETVIRENTALRESQTARMKITEYAPKSNGHTDYLALTDELLKDIEKR